MLQSGRRLPYGPDEPQTIEARVCGGQLVSERTSHMEDRSRLVRLVLNVRHLVCSAQNVGDQLLDHLRV